MQNRLFVGNLSWNTTPAILQSFFESVGKVVHVKVISDRETGRSRGFGFIEMETPESAARAIQDLDGQMLDGRAVRVSVATEKPRTSGYNANPRY